MLEFPVRSVPRYGYGNPPRPVLQNLFARTKDLYPEALQGIVSNRSNLLKIPLKPENNTDPSWMNDWFHPLYFLLAGHSPRRLFENGSGESAKFARRSITDNRLATKIVSIDPKPRSEINSLCDRVGRSCLEDVDLLQTGDFLFIDGTHRCFMNSDVTVVFMELLPSSKPGVFVHLHKLWLPFDYPPDSNALCISEQHLLATWLMARADHIHWLLPNAFICHNPELVRLLGPLWSLAPLKDVPRSGTSLWFRQV